MKIKNHKKELKLICYFQQLKHHTKQLDFPSQVKEIARFIISDTDQQEIQLSPKSYFNWLNFVIG